MHIENKGKILQIEEAKIVYRNFSGVAGKYNREGDRNFAVVIPTQEIADDLMKEGWNVKIRPPRDEDDEPFIYLPVKIKFNDRGPGVYINTFDGGLERLNEDTIGSLDNIDIVSVSLDIRAYDWEVNGKTGRSAYLQGMEVTQNIDRFAAKYAESHILNQKKQGSEEGLPF